MPFVKLDCCILDSTLWLQRAERELFITALLMAVPYELKTPINQLKVDAIEETGFTVPRGWYGMVESSGPGIVHRAGMEKEVGMKALASLGDPEADSRTPDFEGRRMVRVDGGYIILNYTKYREKDHTSAERSKRYRERLAKKRSPRRISGIKAESGYVRAEQNGASPEQLDSIVTESLPRGLQ